LQRRSDRRSESFARHSDRRRRRSALNKYGLEQCLADQQTVGDEGSTLEDLIVEIRVAVANAGVQRDVSTLFSPVPIASVS